MLMIEARANTRLVPIAWPFSCIYGLIAEQPVFKFVYLTAADEFVPSVVTWHVTRINHL